MKTKALAYIKLAQYRREVDKIIVPHCPFCGKKHSHGAADSEIRVGALVARLSHCVGGGKPYEIEVFRVDRPSLVHGLSLGGAPSRRTNKA